MAAAVERKQGHEHDIEPVRVDHGRGVLIGFGNAEAVRGQVLSRQPRRKSQMLIAGEHRQECDLATSNQCWQCMAQRQFTAHCPIHGDAQVGQELRQSLELFADAARRCDALSWAKRHALRAHAASQFVAFTVAHAGCPCSRRKEKVHRNADTAHGQTLDP